MINLRIWLFILSAAGILVSFALLHVLFNDASCNTNTSTQIVIDSPLSSSSSSIFGATKLLSVCGVGGDVDNMQMAHSSYMTLEQCQQRQKELLQQISAESELYHEMIQKAHQRANRNEYNRHYPQNWKSLFQANYKEISNLLLDGKTATIETETELETTKTTTTTIWANFSKNSFPDLSIMGFPKAGTSQLYKLLASHPDARPVFKRKEFCMDHGHFLDYTKFQNQDDESIQALQKKLFTYHKHVLHKRFMDSNNANSTQGLLVNACLQMNELAYHMAYTEMPESSKFLVLFRDPADWLWASWNFWVDKNLDINKPVDHDWASSGLHYRSPELFHELILSQGTTKSAGMRFRKMREQTVHDPRQLLFLVDDPNRIMFIKSEDMKHDVDNFLNRLSEFSGLSRTNFNTTVAYSQTNCNAQKGYQTSCNTSATNSAYAITRHRPMLEATRQLIYIQFFEECKVWAEEFGIIYRDCLRAMPRPQEEQTQQV